MGIQIANLTAQVGADLSQFKMGMNEVNARLDQVATKATNVTNRVETLRRKSIEAFEDSQIYAAQASRARSPERRLILTRKANRAIAQGIDRDTAADDLQADYDKTNAVVQAYSARLEENAREHLARMMNTLSGLMQTAGAAITTGMTGAVMAGSKFNSMMLQTIHNTSLTAEGADILRESVAKMGLESGADLEQLAKGFQKVENFSFSATESAKIMEIAMKSSVATGSDMGKTGELLAKILVQFGMGADKAGAAMNVLHVAANLSSLEMSQLVEVGGQTFSMASNMGLKLTDAAASLVTFTKMGLNAHEAMTQFRNEVARLVQPTEKVKKILDDVKKRSGIDLAAAFSFASLKSKGLAGSFGLIREAAIKMNVDVRTLANQLFPNLRGTIGAMITSSDKGFQTLTTTIEKLDEALSGKVDPTTVQFNETMKTTQAQMNRAKNAIVLLTAEIATALTPTVIDISGRIRSFLQDFIGLSSETKKSRIEFVFWAGATLLVAGTVGKVVVGIAALRNAFIALNISSIIIPAIDSLIVSFKLAGMSVAYFQGSLMALHAGTLVATAAFAGFALVIAAVTAGIIYYNRTAAEANDLQNNMNKNAKATAESDLKKITADQQKAAKLDDLIKRYEVLKTITPPTVKQQEDLRNVLNEISLLAPELITNYTNTGDAISLIGTSAEISASKLAEMNRQLQISAARKINVDFQDSRDFAGQLKIFQEAIKSGDKLKYMQATLDPQLQNEPDFFGRGGGLSDMGKRLEAFGIDFNINAFTGVSKVLDPKWRRTMLDRIASALAAYGRESKEVFNKAAVAFNSTKPFVNLGTGGINSAEGGNPFVPSPKETKDKKKRDPLEEWRRYIKDISEKLYKLNNSDQFKDIGWMEYEAGLTVRLSNMKKLNELTAEATTLTNQYNSAIKRFDEGKSYDKAMQSILEMSHQPKSQRLGDIARWQVGDPSKDRWSAIKSNILGGASFATMIQRPEFLTGNDPEKKNWLPFQKQNYIKAQDKEQERRDGLAAAKQLKQAFEDANKPLEKELSILEQTVLNIRQMPELYAKAGEAGAIFLGMVAQVNADTAKYITGAQKVAKAWVEGGKEAIAKRMEGLKEDFKKLGDMIRDEDIRKLLESASIGDHISASMEDMGSEFDRIAGRIDYFSDSLAKLNLKEKDLNDEQWRAVKLYANTWKELDRIKRKQQEIQQVTGEVQNIFATAFDAGLQNANRFFSELGNGFKRAFLRTISDLLAAEAVRSLGKLFGVKNNGLEESARSARNDLLIAAAAIAASAELMKAAAKEAKKETQTKTLSALGTATGGAWGGLAGLVLGGLFADGGRPMPGRAAIVGERGPELFIPDMAGTVYSNADSKKMMNGAGSNGSIINVTNTGDNHFYNDMDADIVASKTANKLTRKLRYG